MKSPRKTSNVGRYKIRVKYKYFEVSYGLEKKEKKYLKIGAWVENINVDLICEKDCEEHNSVNYKKNYNFKSICMHIFYLLLNE